VQTGLLFHSGHDFGSFCYDYRKKRADIGRVARPHSTEDFYMQQKLLTQFISLRLRRREFKRFHRYGEGMLQRSNLIDAGAYELMKKNFCLIVTVH
jgi:hypothetical protein